MLSSRAVRLQTGEKARGYWLVVAGILFGALGLSLAALGAVAAPLLTARQYRRGLRHGNENESPTAGEAKRAVAPSHAKSPTRPPLNTPSSR